MVFHPHGWFPHIFESSPFVSVEPLKSEYDDEVVHVADISATDVRNIITYNMARMIMSAPSDWSHVRGRERGVLLLGVLIKLIVRVRHALIHKVMTLVYMFIHTCTWR